MTVTYPGTGTYPSAGTYGATTTAPTSPTGLPTYPGPATYPGSSYPGVSQTASPPDTNTPVGGYCSPAQAVAAGARGTDAQLDAAILAATARIERYTREWFLPRTATVRARIDHRGLALLPRRVQTVTAVTSTHPDALPLAATGYEVRSSSTLGDVDAIARPGGWAGSWGGWAGHNDLIVGAESYRGGYANLLGDGLELLVTGTFGWTSPPDPVVQACAQLTAALTTGGGDGPVGVDGEGNPTGLADPELTFRGRGTGLPAADDLLAPYRRNTVLVG